MVAKRVAAVVVTEKKDLKSWVRGDFAVVNAPRDADGGSATPITADGYFLTADHVISHMEGGRNVFLVHGQSGRMGVDPVRVVWRSEADDIALLHVARKTPLFYEWTPPGEWLPAGNRLIHGGIATGRKLKDGRLGTGLRPERAIQGSRRFKMDLPLQPGDSGGPVVDARGRLVGINNAVEFLVPLETAFFIDSEGSRPNTRMIERLIAEDRARKVKE